jgi:uncharacterized protein YjeT (DUF2065 family)
MGRKLLAAAKDVPDASLRLVGAFAVAAGVILVWMIRG